MRSLLTNLADGTVSESIENPSGKTNFFFAKYGKSYPVFLIPAAIPLIVNSAPLSNSLLLYVLLDSSL